MGLLGAIASGGGFSKKGRDFLFKGKESTFDPMSAFTPEQRKSVEGLQQLAATGTGAGITLGEGFQGPLGEFEQTQGELAALEGLRGIVGGDNRDLGTARDVFTKAAETKFDPDDPSSGFAAFSRALAKSGSEAQDRINREAARTGGVFGSGRGRDTASLEADLANQRGQFLAGLFGQAETRKLQGAKGLQDLATQEAAFNQQLAQREAVERQLKDAKAKAELSEFKRTRAEELSRIGLMQEQMQNPLAPITTTSPSLFQQLLPAIGTAAGAAFGGSFGGPAGASAGAKAGGSFGSSFSRSSSGNQPGTGRTQSEILGFNTAQFR